MKTSADFFTELTEVREDFVNFINAQKWDNEMRTMAESLIIMVDQFKDFVEDEKIEYSKKAIEKIKRLQTLLVQTREERNKYQKMYNESRLP